MLQRSDEVGLNTSTNCHYELGQTTWNFQTLVSSVKMWYQTKRFLQPISSLKAEDIIHSFVHICLKKHELNAVQGIMSAVTHAQRVDEQPKGRFSEGPRLSHTWGWFPEYARAALCNVMQLNAKCIKKNDLFVPKLGRSKAAGLVVSIIFSVMTLLQSHVLSRKAAGFSER